MSESGLRGPKKRFELWGVLDELHEALGLCSLAHGDAPACSSEGKERHNTAVYPGSGHLAM
jgi:hypothetical protein